MTLFYSEKTYYKQSLSSSILGRMVLSTYKKEGYINTIVDW